MVRNPDVAFVVEIYVGQFYENFTYRGSPGFEQGVALRKVPRVTSSSSSFPITRDTARGVTSCSISRVFQGLQ